MQDYLARTVKRFSFALFHAALSESSYRLVYHHCSPALVSSAPSCLALQKLCQQQLGNRATKNTCILLRLRCKRSNPRSANSATIPTLESFVYAIYFHTY